MIGRRGERRDSAEEGRDPTFPGEDQKRGKHKQITKKRGNKKQITKKRGKHKQITKKRGNKKQITKKRSNYQMCFLGLPYPPPPSISADWNWQKRGKTWKLTSQSLF